MYLFSSRGGLPEQPHHIDCTMSKYKKRVISESDDSDDEGNGTPLASAAGAGAAAAAAATAASASASTSAGMQKTDSAESIHNAETVADGAAILKAAARDGNGNQVGPSRPVPVLLARARDA